MMMKFPAEMKDGGQQIVMTQGCANAFAFDNGCQQGHIQF